MTAFSQVAYVAIHGPALHFGTFRFFGCFLSEIWRGIQKSLVEFDLSTGSGCFWPLFAKNGWFLEILKERRWEDRCNWFGFPIYDFYSEILSSKLKDCYLAVFGLFFAKMAEFLSGSRKRDQNFVPTDLSSQYMTFIQRCNIEGMIARK